MRSENWKNIWNKREDSVVATASPEDIFMELKKINGYDRNSGITFNAFSNQMEEIFANLSFDGKHARFRELTSVYELGCGSAANLYYFLFLAEGAKQRNASQKEVYVGGSDYSETVIDIAQKYMPAEYVRELEVAGGADIATNDVYDAAFSCGVFYYFDTYEYAEQALTRMLAKTRYALGIIDIPDTKMQEAFVAERKKVIKDYDKKYEGLDKIFYPKAFFLDFAAKHELDIKFSAIDLDGYWNNPFSYNVYLYKRA